MESGRHPEVLYLIDLRSLCSNAMAPSPRQRLNAQRQRDYPTSFTQVRTKYFAHVTSNKMLVALLRTSMAFAPPLAMLTPHAPVPVVEPQPVTMSALSRRAAFVAITGTALTPVRVHAESIEEIAARNAAAAEAAKPPEALAAKEEKK